MTRIKAGVRFRVLVDHGTSAFKGDTGTVYSQAPDTWDYDDAVWLVGIDQGEGERAYETRLNAWQFEII